MAITAFLSCSPGLLVRGPGGPASLGPGSHSSIFSLTATAQSGAWGPPLPDAGSLYRILSPTATAQSGAGGPPLLSADSLYRILCPINLNFQSSGLYNNLPSTLLSASVTISHSIQPLDSQGYFLIFLDRMHLLFTQVHFLFWQHGRVGGQYTTLRWPNTLNSKILSSPDTLRMLHAGFATLDKSFLTWPYYWGFCKPEQSFFNNLVSVQWSIAPSSSSPNKYFWLLPWY